MKNFFLVCILFFLTQMVFAQKPKFHKKLPPNPGSVIVPLKEAQTVRVDPHGSKDKKPSAEMVRTTQECTVCHKIENDRVVTIGKAEETCMNCHNKAPHSGAEEHAKSGKVNCTSCHGFHRGDSRMMQENLGMFKDLKAKPLPKGFVEKTKSGVMIKKDCTDCHKW